MPKTPTLVYAKKIRKKFVLAVVAALVVAGMAYPSPALASENSKAGVGVSSRLIDATASAVDRLVAGQINQLVAAYDRSSKRFDPTKVPAATLESEVGKAFTAAISARQKGASTSLGLGVFVAGGADPWPYVQLSGSEQQALVTGSSATLIASICAVAGPETGGVGCGAGAALIAMIVGIIVANGVCPDGREMRIYPLVGPTGFSCQ